MHICVNFFRCSNCGAKWIFRWYFSCGDICPHCKTYQKSYNSTTIETKSGGYKSVLCQSVTTSSTFLCPIGEAKDRIFRKDERF